MIIGKILVHTQWFSLTIFCIVNCTGFAETHPLHISLLSDLSCNVLSYEGNRVINASVIIKCEATRVFFALA